MKPFTVAYILSERKDIATALRSALRICGLEDANMKDGLSADKIIKEIEDKKDAILILDWDAGRNDVLKILAANQHNHKVESRPSLLISSALSHQIVAAGGEFNVTRVHTGEATATGLKLLIKEIYEEYSAVDPLREKIISVAALREEGDWEQATTVLEDALREDEENPRLACELAENYIHEEEWQRAYNVLEPLSKLDPPDVRCLHMLGRVMTKLGRHGDAITALSKARLISPYNVERLVELGNAYLKVDESVKADKVFDEALDLDPDSKDATAGKGTCQLLDGEVNEGLRLIRQVSSPREMASIFNTTAVLTIHRNQHERGMDLYDTAIRSIGGDKMLLARLYYNKGIGFFRWEKPDEARECFEKAAEMDPTMENAIYNLRIATQQSSVQRTGTDDTPVAPSIGDDALEEDLSFDVDLSDAFSDELEGEDENFF